MKVSVLRRPKHSREAAQNMIFHSGGVYSRRHRLLTGVSKRAGDRFPNYFYFSKTFSKKYVFSRELGVFRHSEFENAIHFFFNKIKILLILIFKIHSPDEMFSDRVNYAHALLDFRWRRGVENAACPILTAHKNFAPLKDSVTVITSTRIFIHCTFALK